MPLDVEIEAAAIAFSVINEKWRRAALERLIDSDAAGDASIRIINVSAGENGNLENKMGFSKLLLQRCFCIELTVVHAQGAGV